MTLESLAEKLEYSEWTVLFLMYDYPSVTLKDALGSLYSNCISAPTWNVLEASPADVNEFFSRIEIPESNRTVAVSGNGSRHMLTYGLCTGIADRISDGYAYIHMDHHSDANDFAQSYLTCGEFVMSTVRHSNARTVRFIGSNGLDSVPELYNTVRPEKFADSRYLKEDSIREMGIKHAVEYLLESTPDDVYISMDLDVMDSSEISTDYRWPKPDGTLRTDELLAILNAISKRKNIIGADICGYNGKGKGVDVYQTIIDTLMKN